MWADDFWGEYAFRVWENEIAKALPPERYPIVDIPLDHALFHALYNIRRISRFRRSAHGADRAEILRSAAVTAPCRTCAAFSTMTAGSWC